jgi:hypothetical protein
VTGETFRANEIQLGPATGPAPTLPPAPTSQVDVAVGRFEDGFLRFGPGPVTIESRIDLPKGVDVLIEPGTQLDFGAGAGLMIRGDLSALGTSEQPIRIGSTDVDWQGVFVQGTRLDKSRVALHHTTISGGSGGENERTFFTSSFAVHDGVVEIVDSRFEDSRADDGLNLKYAEVDLSGNLVRGSRDDALDCDFCVGVLRANEIRDSGGDGFDFSGSEVLVEGSRVLRCADKGMSIGERTTARLVENEVTSCYTGVAVKDLSEVVIEGLNLRDLEVGVAAYIKKSTFGPSRVKLVRDVRMQNVATRVLRDASCTIEEGVPALAEAQ